MFKQKMSSWGKGVCWTAGLVCLGAWTWLAAINWGFAGWLNDLQASMRGGECDLRLTIAILMIPCASVCWWLGLAFDRVAGTEEFERIGEVPRSEMRSFAEIARPEEKLR